VGLNVVHVVFQTAELAPERFAVEAWQDAGWKPLAEVTDNRHRRHVLGLDRIETSRLRVVQRVPAGICEIRVYDEPPREVQIARRRHRNMRLSDRGPWLPFQVGFEERRFHGIVCDSSEARQRGYWAHSTWSDSFIGDGYLHDDNAGKGDKSIRFHVGLAAPGKYEVRIAYSAFSNRASNTPVTIHTSRGAETVRIDQRKTPPIEELFLPLGTFSFDAGEAARVEITNAGTDGYVVVDAIQFIPVGDAATRAP
jgi:hypothetical protein